MQSTTSDYLPKHRHQFIEGNILRTLKSPCALDLIPLNNDSSVINRVETSLPTLSSEISNTDIVIVIVRQHRKKSFINNNSDNNSDNNFELCIDKPIHQISTTDFYKKSISTQENSHGFHKEHFNNGYSLKRIPTIPKSPPPQKGKEPLSPS